MKKLFALILVGLLLPTFVVLADDTGWKSPSDNGREFNYWVNPINAYTSNDVYTSQIDNSSASIYHSWETFGFDVPFDAVIEGIEVSLEGKASRDLKEYRVGVWSDSAFDWGLKVEDFNLVEATDIYGSPTDLWGITWVGDDFSNARFSVLFGTMGDNDSDILYLDHLKAKIYYAPLEVCDSEHLELCLTEETCGNAGGYWYNEICNASPEPVCDSENLELCLTEETCENAGGYWYNNVCNAETLKVLDLPGTAIADTTGTITDLIDAIGPFIWAFMGIPLGFIVVKRIIKIIPR